MSVLTLNLPDHLHQNLSAQAQTEGISLEELIVFALSRQSSPGYRIESQTEAQIREQELRRDALRQSLGRVSKEEARRILNDREVVQPEELLDPNVTDFLRAHLARSA